MRFKLFGALAACALFAAAVPVMAHHAVQAQFDFDKPIELKGTMSKMEWINPHAYMHLDVKDASGKVTTWALETVGRGGLRRAGLSRSARGGLEVGQTYSVKAFLAKDGSNTAFLTALTLPDGRDVTIWFGDPNAR